MSAAQSILRISVRLLQPQGYLRLAPCRIFQRILFAATFLLKVRTSASIVRKNHSSIARSDRASQQARSSTSTLR